VGAFEIAAAEVAALGYGVDDVSVGWATGVGADFDGHDGSLFLSDGAVRSRVKIA
jgi:hypothetical protein